MYSLLLRFVLYVMCIVGYKDILEEEYLKGL